MKKNYLLLLAVLCCCFSIAFSQVPSFEWLVSNTNPTIQNYDIAQINSIVTDASGNVYVAGDIGSGNVTIGSLTITEYDGVNTGFVAKFNSSGVIQWVTQSGEHGGNGRSNCSAIVQDASTGELYVAGYYLTNGTNGTFGSMAFSVPGGGYAGFLAQLDPTTGAVNWLNPINLGLANANNHSNSGNYTGLILSGGYLYATGDFGPIIGIDGNSYKSTNYSYGYNAIDAFLAKFDLSGNIQWFKNAGTTATGGNGGITNSFNSLAADASGNILVTGNVGNQYSYSGNITIGSNTYTGYGVYIVKYDVNGNILWNIGQTSSNNSANFISSGIACDNSSNVFVTGEFLGSNITLFGNSLSSSSSGTVYLSELNSSGTAQWSKIVGDNSTSITPYNSQGPGIMIDNSNNFFLWGTYEGSFKLGNSSVTSDYCFSSGNPSMFVSKLSLSGTTLSGVWTKSATSNYEVSGRGFAVDNSSANTYYVGGTLIAVTNCNGGPAPATINFDNFTYTDGNDYYQPYLTKVGFIAPIANFTANDSNVCQNVPITFADKSAGNPTSWSWTFTGGSPSSSTAENPTVTYPSVGTYSVTLEAFNSVGNNTYTKTNFINVVAGAVPGDFTVSPATICPNGTSTLTLSGYTGSIQWDSSTSSTGPWYSTTYNSTTTPVTVTPKYPNISSPTPPTTIYYKAVVSIAGCSSTNSPVHGVTINPAGCGSPIEVDYVPNLPGDDATCGEADGYLHVHVSGGDGSHEYIAYIYGPNNSSTLFAYTYPSGYNFGNPYWDVNFADVASGQYWVNVYDVDNPSDAITAGPFTVLEGICPGASESDVTDCSALSNGSITVDPSGGDGNGYDISVQLNGMDVPGSPLIDVYAGDGPFVFSGLSEGYYSVTVSDDDNPSDGYSTTVYLTINNPYFDCAGTCDGSATEDCAGTCNGSATEDCANVCNGSDVQDPNGACCSSLGCDGYCDGSTDDCAGTCNGSATTDCAGNCNGGATEDCMGTCNGSAVQDPSGNCCSSLGCDGYCDGSTYDCNNNCNGGATTDVCGQCGGNGSSCCNNDCPGGTTCDGYGNCNCSNPGCDGSCDGSTYDCNNNCNGGATDDVCGQCGGDGSSCCNNDCPGGTTCDGYGNCNCPNPGCDGTCDGSTYDCNNNCNGGATTDVCGQCGGDGSSCCNNDCPGGTTCDGYGNCNCPNPGCDGSCDGSTYDCNNNCNGGATTDVCGQCGGNGSSCCNNDCPGGTTCDGYGNCDCSNPGCDGSCDGSTYDCNNNCNGGATTDVCGQCNGNGSTCCNNDCSYPYGSCDGMGNCDCSAGTDDCGVCGGDGSSCACQPPLQSDGMGGCYCPQVDACGVCGGDGSSCCNNNCMNNYSCDGNGNCYCPYSVDDNGVCCSGTIGCNGICNSGEVYDCDNNCGGGAIQDACGECGGNGNECCNNNCPSGYSCDGNGNCIQLVGADISGSNSGCAGATNQAYYSGASGGSGSYTFSWSVSGGDIGSSGNTSDPVTINWDQGNTEATIYVTVTDANNSNNSATSQFNVSVGACTTVTDGGITVSLSETDDFCTVNSGGGSSIGNGSVTAVISGGDGNYTVNSITTTGGTQIFPVCTDCTNPSPPYTYVYNSVPANGSTQYSVQVEDGSFTVMPSAEITVNYNSSIPCNLTFESANGYASGYCGSNANGVINAQASGGAYPYSYIYTLYDAAGNQVGVPQNTNNGCSFSSLSGGVYTIVVTDPNTPGLTATSNPITVGNPSGGCPITASVSTPVAPSTCGGSDGGFIVTLTGGGDGTYPYTVNVYNTGTQTDAAGTSPEPMDINNSSNSALNPVSFALASGSYDVVITDQTSGDTYSDLAVVVPTNCNNTPTWTGNGDPTSWLDPNNWGGNPPTGTCSDNVVINPATNEPDITTSESVGNISLASGASVTIDRNVTLSVCGNITGGTGTDGEILGPGTLLLNSASGQQQISGMVEVQDIIIDNSSGVQVQSGTELDIYNSLVLQLGQFDATSGTVKLKSTSVTSAAIIDNFSGGQTGGTSQGSYKGTIIAERFYGAASASNDFSQHMVGTPVGGLKLSALGATNASAAYYQPFTGNAAGTADPNNQCDELLGAPGTPYGNVFSYDETHASACTMSGWLVGAANTAASAGTGYSMVLGGGSGTFSLTGPPNLNTGYTVPATNSGYPNTVSDQGRTYTSGINLVSNPYPAPLLISALVGDNSSFSETVYVWNESTGSYYTPVDGIIAPFQAFKVILGTPGVQSSANYVINGTSRTTTAGTFQRTANPMELSMTVANNSTGLTDETTVGFNPASTAQFNPTYDLIKLPGALTRHTLYTLNSNDWMWVNVLKSIDETSTVPVGFEPGVSGTYTTSFNGLNSFDPTSYITLEDKQTGTMFNVRNGDYTFTSDATSDSWNRFVLHFTPPASITATDASCSEQGMINIVQPGTAIWNYTLTDNNNVTLSSGTLNVNSPVTASVPSGTYTLTLVDDNGYTVVKSIQVNGVQPVVASFTSSTCCVNVNQEVTLSSTAAGAAINSWNFGDGTTDNGTTVSHSYTSEGIYNVTLNSTSASGCTSSASNSVTVTQSVTGLSNLNDINNILIWSNENIVNVDFSQLSEVQANIEIYNILGQKLSDDKYVTSTVYRKEIPNIEEGYIVVTVKNNDQIISKKLFISNVK